MRASAPTITPQELSKKLSGSQKEQPVLLDVRSASEHALVALPHSTLIPLDELPGRYAELQADGKEIIVYCHHGMRSLQGAAFLISKGLKARSLVGGIDAYAQAVDPSLRRY